MTPEERELKNKRISESIKATREKRKNQHAKVARWPCVRYAR